MSLSQVRHWVFDMDGTLTVAVHDFAAIRQALAIPPEHDILTHLAALPAEEAAAKHAWLLEHERDLALGSRPAPGAVELVRELAGRGYRLGILTRNARELAHVTLEAIGLADCFALEELTPFEFAHFAHLCAIDRRLLAREAQRMAKAAPGAAAKVLRESPYTPEEHAFAQRIAAYATTQAQRLVDIAQKAAALPSDLF